MSAQDDLNNELFNLGRGASKTAEGLVTAVDLPSRVVTVNIGGTTQQMPWKGDAPWVGCRVRVDSLGLRPVCEPVWPAAVGTVTGLDGDFVVVLGDDGVVSRYPHDASQLFVVSDRVALHHASRSVMYQLSSDPSLDDPVVPLPPPSGGPRQVTFPPVNSGNWWTSGGRYESQNVEISTTRSGYYFYGTAIADTIPNTATILAASIQLGENWDNVPGTPSAMGLHTMPYPVAPPAAISGGYINVSGSGWVDIMSFAPYLRDGSAYGIGFVQNTGWRQFANYTASGAITITWQ